MLNIDELIKLKKLYISKFTEFEKRVNRDFDQETACRRKLVDDYIHDEYSKLEKSLKALDKQIM